MKLSDLDLFIDIVTAGGLTQAANRRGLSQPAVSRSLRDLETRMQARLLQRTGRGVDLTPAGAEFLSFAQNTIAQFDATRAKVTEMSDAMPKLVRLSVPLRLGRLLIADLHRAWAERMPNVALQVVEEHSDRATEMLKRDKLDAAIVYTSATAKADDTLHLFSDTLVAVGTDPKFAATQQPITLGDLSTFPLLVPSTGAFRKLIDGTFRSVGLEITLARALETAEGLLAFAAEGDGLTILPMSNVFAEVARGEVVARRIVAPEITRNIGLRLRSGISTTAGRIVHAATRQAMQRSARTVGWGKIQPVE